MSTLQAFDPASVTDPESCRRWLAALPEDGPERLAAVGRLLLKFGRPGLPLDASVAILEQVRAALLPAVDGCLVQLRGRQMPYGADAWRRFADAMTTLRALRTMYRRAASRMSREAQAEGLARALPLFRALDLQSRIVSALLTHRVEPLPEDWDELCELGRRARATGLVDLRLPEEMPVVEPATARASFVYPLLLRLSGLPERSHETDAAVAALAGRLAAQVGFRIDAGASRENPLGPVLALTVSWSVRLDAHRIPAILASQRAQRLAEAGSPDAMRALSVLVADLERRWTCTAVGAPGAREAAAWAALQFGLPRLVERPAQDATARGGRGAPRQAGAYEFGRWERNTIVRLSIGSAEEAGAAPEWDAFASAELARCLSHADGRVEVERHLMLPPALLGGLVALRIGPSQAAGQGGPGVEQRLGTVAAVQQLAAPGYERIRGHRLGVALWPGATTVVGLRLGAGRFFEHAWLLRADAGAVGARESLVTAPGLAAPGGRAVLRDGGRDRPVRFSAVLDGGPGFERIGFVDDVV